MIDILEVLKSTVEQSTLADFKKYAKQIQGTADKYMIFSDYCLDDRQKPNNVVTFSIVPYMATISTFSAIIKSKAPKDLKSTRSPSKEFQKILKNDSLFHFTLILENRHDFTKGREEEDEKIIKQMSTSIGETIQEQLNSDTYSESERKIFHKKWQELEQELNKRNPNYKLFKDVVLIALFVGYIASLIKNELNASDIAWFSDRDKVITKYLGIVLELANVNFHSIYYETNKEPLEFGLTVSQPKETEKLWYEELNKIPDYIAGTVADLNIKDGSVSKDKFNTMLSNVFADNNKCVVLKLDLSRNNFKCTRVKISQSEHITQ